VGTEALRGVRIASIGPITSETLRRNGLTVAVEAVTYTIEGLSTQFKAVSGLLPAAGPLRCGGYIERELALFVSPLCFWRAVSKTIDTSKR